MPTHKIHILLKWTDSSSFQIGYLWGQHSLWTKGYSIYKYAISVGVYKRNESSKRGLSPEGYQFGDSTVGNSCCTPHRDVIFVYYTEQSIKQKSGKMTNTRDFTLWFSRQTSWVFVGIRANGIHWNVEGFFEINEFMELNGTRCCSEIKIIIPTVRDSLLIREWV